MDSVLRATVRSAHPSAASCNADRSSATDSTVSGRSTYGLPLRGISPTIEPTPARARSTSHRDPGLARPDHQDFDLLG
jgi:hypothetical protein